jgi:CRP-like cAMP-binding protein
MSGVQTIEQYLPGHPFFAGLDDQAIGLVTGCAVNAHLRPGEHLFREGEPADTFYVIRSGRVAIEMRLPTGEVVLDTARDGDVVGWSWLVAPYRWTFDAVAMDETSVVSIDGACLRGKCDADPALGYALLQRVVQVMSKRLHSARVRLLDLYGKRS